MQAEKFREWYKSSGAQDSTVSAKLSQIARIEKHVGSLDEVLSGAGRDAVFASFTYTKDDEKQGRISPAPFEIPGDI
jgi:hypothetical protein